MSRLIVAAKYCLKSVENFDKNGIWKQKILQEPVEIIDLLERIDKMGNGLIGKSPDVEDLENLYKKIIEAFNLTGRLDSLNNREIKMLPFIMQRVTNEKLIGLIMHIINSNNKVGLLRAEILAYFINYGSKGTEFLGKDIQSKLQYITTKIKIVKNCQKNLYLFGKDAIEETKMQCLQIGFFKYLQKLQFSKLLIGSQFIRKLVCSIYDDGEWRFNLWNKLDLFKELYTGEHKELFVNLVPKMLGNLILCVDKSSGNDIEQIKQYLRPIIMHELGDPRLPRNADNNWALAGYEAKKIFIKWISKYDLGLFFKIIGEGLKYDSDARRMWQYRKKFWQSYENEIDSVWVFFGKTTLRDVRKENHFVYGEFVGDSIKSCILMEIGNFIFVERSHNGKIKVFKKKDSPFCIGDANIKEYDIVNTPMDIEAWSHSSSETYSWQRKVAAFIYNNIGIYKNKSDWY